MDKVFPYMVISAKAGRGYGVDEMHPDLDNTLKEAIRQQWAPSGQGWSQFVGASFVRTIHLPNNQSGWVQIRVTSEQDEFGRGGLLWARITVIPRSLISRFAEDYLATLPSSARNVSKRYLPSIIGLYWRTFWNVSTVFSAPRSFISSWSLVEASILRTFLSLPTFMRESATISTLALSTKNAGTLIGVPSENLQRKAHVLIGPGWREAA